MYSRRAGEWTERLQQLAETFDASKPFKMYIEGPYGNLTVPLPMYKHVMLISGGLGATPMFSIYNDMKRHSLTDSDKKNQVVQFIWSMRDQKAMEAMWLDIQQFEKSSNDSLHDQSVARPLGFTEHLHTTSAINQSLHPTLEGVVVEGRPPLDEMFSTMEEHVVQAISETSQSISQSFTQPNNHCAVLVCGPAELITTCRKLCASRSKFCGSRICFDMHDERFEW
jgi:ferredoxin-NADP reductase